MKEMGEVFFSLLTLNNLLYMNIGLLGGIVVGALPGLTATMAVALLVPMTYGLDATTGILMLLGVYCGGTYGGSITAILINTREHRQRRQLHGMATCWLRKDGPEKHLKWHWWHRYSEDFFLHWCLCLWHHKLQNSL